MTISYPLTTPSSPSPSRVEIEPVFVIASHQSVFTLSAEYFEHYGQQWQMNVQLPPMQRADAEEWIAWMLSLNGSYGTFLMGDISGQTPRGSLGGTPLVDGAHSTLGVKEISTKGWSASTSVLLKGDYIQLGTSSNARIYKSLKDVTSDGSGDATIDIFPRLKIALTDEQSIITSNTVGVWRLVPPYRWTIQNLMLFGMTFKAIEDMGGIGS